MMSFFDEILQVGSNYLLKQLLSNGVITPGHNGPYQDPETPVRNTAHSLLIFAELFIRTSNPEYAHASEKLIDYLLSADARPFDKTFLCRSKSGKDRCNGLIGQAWVMEALITASLVFDRPDCYALAEEVFLLHPWNEKIGLWSRIEVDGTVLSCDGTFNHQLWFAAAGGMLYKTPLARSRAKSFLEKNAAQVRIYSDGVIFHLSNMGSLVGYLGVGFSSFAAEIKRRVKNLCKKHKLYSKSVGYHGFNLYAFAMLYNEFPELVLWESNRFKRVLSAPEGAKFIETLKLSEFGYFYNLSGIEIAYAYEVFGIEQSKIISWLDRQVAYTYEDDSNSFTRNATDINTAKARTYELVRFQKDYKLGGMV